MASSASEESATRPSPADFEEFIPWACYQSGVEAAIVVIRSDLGKTFYQTYHICTNLYKYYIHIQHTLGNLSLL